MSNKEQQESSKEQSCCQDLREEFRLHRFKLEHPHPVHFVSSQWFKSTVYIVWSGVWALYHFAMLMLDIYYNKNDGGIFLVYLTNWNYILVFGFSISDFAIALYVHLKRKDIVEDTDPSLSTTWYMKSQWIVLNIINTAAILVTLLYYGLLDVEWTHSSTNKHLLNSVYILASLLFSAKPIRLLHMHHPFIFALLYIICNVIYHVSGGGAIYSALDWNKTGSAILLAALVLFIGVPVIHIFCFALYTLRLFLFAKCFNNVSKDENRKKNMQREVTPRDVALREVSQSRHQSRTSNNRPTTSKTHPGLSRPGTNRPETSRPKTMSVLPV